MRLDSAVLAALQARAADSGRSLSGEANAHLRRALNLTPGVQTAAARAHVLPASIGAATLPGARPRRAGPLPTL